MIKKIFQIIIFLYLLIKVSTCFAIDTVKVTENDALFNALDHTLPVVSTHYVGWSEKWKWAGVKVNATHTTENAQYFESHFNGSSSNLAINFNGSVFSQHNGLQWNYKWNKTIDIPNAIGIGIEFNLLLNSPSFDKPALPPSLLADNKGWSWQTPDGQSIEVTFAPSLAKLYFERGKKNIIRALFFSSITAGSEQTTMTVKVSKNVKASGPDILNYDTLNFENWHKNILPTLTSPIDLSFLNNNHIPAGKHGFVNRKNSQLVFEDGTPVKFWGTNLMANALFITPDEEIKHHAKRIAQLGFNLVRIHHHDSKWVKPNIFKNTTENTLELSNLSLKKLDWWIKCLKNEGIYIWLDLHVGRSMTQNDGITDFDDFAKGKLSSEIKGFNYYNESIQKAMRAFNQAYLTHVNQYTGVAYIDDPALISLLITNENDLTHHFGNKLLPNKNVPTHNAVFSDDVKQFADTNSLPYNKTRQTWKMGESKIYLNDAEHRFNQNMILHLKSLGLKSLIATTNSWGKMGILSLPSLTDGNIIDAHSYGRAEELKNNPRYKSSFLTWIGAAQVSGKPLSVTEWNIEPFPARDRFVAPLLTASIASFQGWDALMQYGYSQAKLGGWAKGSNYSSYNDPAIMGLMPASALLYRQNHVSSAINSYELKLNRNDFFFVRQDPRSSKTIRTLLETSQLTIGMPEVPELPWLKENIASNGDSIVINDANKDFIPAGQNYVESDTGELKRDWEKGIQTINTPKSQVISGWVGGERIKLDDVTFKINTKKAVVAVQSLENRPISDSKKIYITIMARSEPSKGNKLPFYSEPVIGKIRIKAPKGLKLYPINNLGETEKPISNVSYRRNRYVINFTSDINSHWFLLKE